MMRIDELRYDLCEGCGERHPTDQGFIAQILHCCELNTVYYYGGGSLRMQHLYDLFAGRNPIQEMKDLLIGFPHFKKMPDFDTATDSEKRIYAMCREMEIKQMHRMWEYIKLEDRLYNTLKSGLI